MPDTFLDRLECPVCGEDWHEDCGHINEPPITRRWIAVDALTQHPDSRIAAHAARLVALLSDAKSEEERSA